MGRAGDDMQLSALQSDRLLVLAAAMGSAPVAQRKLMVQAAAAELGKSVQTVYRWLATHGQAHSPIARAGRSRRCDAGSTEVTLTELQAMSGILMSTIRRTGNRIMSFEAALELARSAGMVQCALSAGRLAVLLREQGLHPDQMSGPTAAIEQRSLHANHVWQVDASVCVAYYLSNATGMQVMDETKFYKNKPGNLTRIQQERLIRYAVADHYSHTLAVRYYLGSESAANLTDFLIWCFCPKPHFLMHGVPLRLQMDMGSANTSAPTLNMLKRLDVAVDIHQRHNSRANGAVEKAHHIWEMGFESALAFTHVADLQDLNYKAELWAHGFCAKAKHTRHKQSRYAVWTSIKAEQLRLAPSQEVLRELPTLTPQTRVVSANLTVTMSFTGALKHLGTLDYDLRFVPGIKARDKVQVVANIFAAPALDVAYQDSASGLERWMTVQPSERGADGRLIDAPVIGQEMRSAARTVVDAQRDAVLLLTHGAGVAAPAGALADVPLSTTEALAQAKAAKERGALPFGGAVDAFAPARAAVAQLPTYLPKRGVALDAPVLRATEMARYTVVRACAVVRARVDAQHYPKGLYAQWDAQYGPAGVPEDVVDALVLALGDDALGTDTGVPLQSAAGGM